MNAPQHSFWAGRTAALGTMHEKEKIISPLLRERLDLEVRVPKEFDSDQFGTFTRDVKRSGNQLEAARAKARAAMEHLGCNIGLASEGSFSNDPELPFIARNIEIVVLLDTTHNLEIIGQYQTTNTIAKGTVVRDACDVMETARSWGFPEQGVILRRSENSTRDMHKELVSEDALETTAKRLLDSWFTRSLYLETDLRAHRCPARRDAIRRATENLLENCLRLCPKCDTPGFTITETKRGLPCSNCGRPTDRLLAEIYACQKCAHEETRPLSDEAADPGDCAHCNP